MPDGSLSAPEANGGVAPGDYIVAVEGAPTAGVGYEEVRCHNIAGVWLAFSSSGLHSSQDGDV